MKQWMKTLDFTAMLLAIIGAINWGLVGALRFDLVQAIFGSQTFMTRLIYVLVGLSGLYGVKEIGRAFMRLMK